MPEPREELPWEAWGPCEFGRRVRSRACPPSVHLCPMQSEDCNEEAGGARTGRRQNTITTLRRSAQPQSQPQPSSLANLYDDFDSSVGFDYEVAR